MSREHSNPPARARIPVSTYRLQLNRDFRFADARRMVPYLARLGVTDCYLSPLLQASPGSMHGYDICDHNRFNAELGTEAEYDELTAELERHRMGQLLDFVPNHMGIDPVANLWWRDVLENGRCSQHADFFDIEWHPVKAELHEKILLPLLGDPYGQVLDRGELQVAYDDGLFHLRYFDHDLPINPRQFTRILEYDVAALGADLGEDSPDLIEYLSITTSLRNLPLYTETAGARVAERQREKEVARERLDRLVRASARVRQHIERAVGAFNRSPFDALHELLEEQPYRLAYWRTASHEINYRRFFDINQLAGLRMDDPRVFDATHELILRLARTPQVTGLRLDHVDGLLDPAGYLARLHQAIIAPEPGGAGGPPKYVVVEKILSTGETLPEEWPVAGTTGYEFLNDLNGAFIAGENKKALARVYRRFTGVREPFEDIVYHSKRLIMDTSMASELNVLAHALNRISERDRRTRDFTLNSLREVLRELVACFPIYRTYRTASEWTVADREAVETAIRKARRRNPTIEPTVLDFLTAVVLPDASGAEASEEGEERAAFAMKLQQLTSPVEAKGREDTSFYRYNLLTSMNEVGGDPDRFGCTPSELHDANRRRRERWPHTMLASATHDTKRGEDVRARLNVLSEIPEDWGRQVSLWARINAGHRTTLDAGFAPDRNDEYLFYQTLLGIWPPGAETPDATLCARLRDYMIKATREAKVHTSWLSENRAYEDAVGRFIDRALTGASSARFLAAFLPVQKRIARLGMVNSLSQTVLKVVSPGVPDFYQGTELWDLSLVDPDNRRPVDYTARGRMLDEIEPLLASRDRADVLEAMLAAWGDGRVKLLVTAAALRLRRDLADVFLSGTYESVDASGPSADHVIAVVRRHQGKTVLAVVPRLLAQLAHEDSAHPLPAAVWADTTLHLPDDLEGPALENVFTGESVRIGATQPPALTVGSVLGAFPVALLAAPSAARS